MNAFIVGDNPTHATRLLERLHRAGLDCPAHCVVSLASARGLIHSGQPIDVLFVVDGEGPARLAENLRSLRGATAAALVAVGCGNQTAAVLSAIRAGATDYLDEAGEFEAELSATLARLRGSVASKQRRGTTICITSASGGSGASSLAINLGAALATAQKPCCLIDLKVRGGDLAPLLNLRSQHTIVDLCFQGERIDETMFQQTLLVHPQNLRLLAAPPFLDSHGGIDSEVVAQILDLARDSFPHVVIDLEDVVHREQARAIRECDDLLIVLRLDFPCILRTRRMLDFLREAGIDLTKVRLVANRCGQTSELPKGKAVEALGMPIFHFLPEDHVAMLSAVNLGNPVVLESPRSAVAKSFRKLAELLIASAANANYLRN